MTAKTFTYDHDGKTHEGTYTVSGRRSTALIHVETLHGKSKPTALRDSDPGQLAGILARELARKAK